MPPLCGSTELSRLEPTKYRPSLRGRDVTLRKRRVARSKYAEPAPDEFDLPMVPELSQRAIGGQRRVPFRSQTAMCIFSARDSPVENAGLRRGGPAEVWSYGNKLLPNGNNSAYQRSARLLRNEQTGPRGPRLQEANNSRTAIR
jgi:hypothetical protein